MEQLLAHWSHLLKEELSPNSGGASVTVTVAPGWSDRRIYEKIDPRILTIVRKTY